MSIRLSPSPTFKFRVELAVPGSTEPGRITLIGRHLKQTALREWAERAKEMEGKDAEFLLEVITGWDSEVVDDDGKPVKFSPEAFSEFVDNHPGSALQVFEFYIRELSAGRRKN